MALVKKPKLTPHAATDEEGHPFEHPNEAGAKLCRHWSAIFRARMEDTHGEDNETILGCVQRVPVNTQWLVYAKKNFVPMLAAEHGSPGFDGTPSSVYTCLGGTGADLLFATCFKLLDGVCPPSDFVESKTVFIPTSTAVDERGRIICPSPPRDALRQLTLCNCDCNVLATAICFGLRQYCIACIHPVQRRVATGQMTDNIFEIVNHPDGLCVSLSCRQSQLGFSV